MQTFSPIHAPRRQAGAAPRETAAASVAGAQPGTPEGGTAAQDPPSASQARFGRFASFVLIYNLPVILFGAFVRATGSGAGCGSHWPLCNGQVIPRPENVETLIEFSHRIMSGLDGFLVLALLLAAFRRFPRGHRVRYGAIFSLFFTVNEALIGALLVKNGWVVDNDSVGRAVFLSAHLANTFLLLAALAVTAWWAGGGGRLRLPGQGAVGYALGLGLASTLILGVSGVITALGDTLYPVRSSGEAIAQGLAPGAHYLVKLRLLHPLLAMTVGLYLVLLTGLVGHLRPAPAVRRFGGVVGGLFVAQIGAGFLNKALLAPVWMQVAHLLLADLLWIGLVLFAAAALAEEAPQGERAAAPDAAAGKATWKDYVALTKPRVISLLLFTTLAAMLIAAQGWPGIGLFLAVAVGGYLSAGAANAINMVIDRDIDGRMRRTAKRPTVTRRIPSHSALWFGLGLAAVSFALLWAAANLLAATLSLAGLVFYVIVYTLLLKRRTRHNIVIGGAAGAFPPLVGWAAVAGDLGPLAWLLFALIFVWTPVHFWALALLLKDDYAEAGVPMLPVVRGERITVLQIGMYAVLTVVVSILPFLTRDAGWGYLGAIVLLDAVLLLRSLQLFRQIDRPRTVGLYKYSMLYLALLFLAMAVDRMVWT